MSVPTRPASQAGNPIKGGEETDSFGSESPRLEVAGHLRSIVANQYLKSLFAGLPRLPWSSQCRAGESQRVQRQQHTP